MIIEKFGIRLLRLTREDIELVRTWRNDPKVARFMAFRGHITREMQERWFATVDNDDNYFFLIEHAGRKVGLGDLKGIDRAARTAESGIFIAEEEALHTLVPFRVALASHEFAFGEVGIETVFCRILRSNARAIRFNTAIGYVLEEGQEGVELQRYRLTRESFERFAARVRGVLLKA